MQLIEGEKLEVDRMPICHLYLLWYGYLIKSCGSDLQRSVKFLNPWHFQGALKRPQIFSIDQSGVFVVFFLISHSLLHASV